MPASIALIAPRSAAASNRGTGAPCRHSGVYSDMHITAYANAHRHARAHLPQQRRRLCAVLPVAIQHRVVGACARTTAQQLRAAGPPAAQRRRPTRAHALSTRGVRSTLVRPNERWIAAPLTVDAVAPTAAVRRSAASRSVPRRGGAIQPSRCFHGRRTPTLATAEPVVRPAPPLPAAAGAATVGLPPCLIPRGAATPTHTTIVRPPVMVVSPVRGWSLRLSRAVAVGTTIVRPPVMVVSPVRGWSLRLSRAVAFGAVTATSRGLHAAAAAAGAAAAAAAAPASPY